MLTARHDERLLQNVTLMILRTREQQMGTGMYYQVDLRREVLVPDTADKSAWLDPDINKLGAAMVSSNIGGSFTHVPPGYRKAKLYGVVGTIVETPSLLVPTIEGDVVVDENPTDLVCMMEILEEDLKVLQEQNQMALLLHARGILHLNAQYYGKGFDEDGRDREILRGSVWCTPQYMHVEFSRPAARSAAGSAEEIREIITGAKEKNSQRAMSARAESLANRQVRDEERARAPMPQRRGTNVKG